MRDQVNFVMAPGTKRILLCVTLVNIAFFVYLIYMVWTEYDTFLLYKTYLHTVTEVDKELLHTIGMGVDRVPGEWMMLAEQAANLASLFGLSHVLFGNQRHAVLPITRSEATLLSLLTVLADTCYIFSVRACFANSYGRAWMIMADDIYFPVLFFVVTLYGCVQLRRGRTPPSPAQA